MSSESKSSCVVDTNIWISAFVFGGFPEKILNLVIERKIRSVTSRFILSEFERVTARKNFLISKEIKKASSIILENSILIEPISSLDLIAQKHSDNRILECALDGNVNYLITGDRQHLLPLKKMGPTKIVTVREFIEQTRDTLK